MLSPLQIQLALAQLNRMSAPDREAALRQLLRAMPLDWVEQAHAITAAIISERRPRPVPARSDVGSLLNVKV